MGSGVTLAILSPNSSYIQTFCSLWAHFQTFYYGFHYFLMVFLGFFTSLTTLLQSVFVTAGAAFVLLPPGFHLQSKP